MFKLKISLMKNVRSFTLTSTVALLCLVLTALQVSAQKRPISQNKSDEIKAQKTAFITSQLELTPEEAQVFWPVFNEYSAKREDIHKEMFGPEEPKGHPDMDKMTEQEAEQFLDNMVRNQQKMTDLEKEYIVKFKKVLSAKKIVKLHKVEQDFKRLLLKKLRDHKRPPKGGE